MNKLWRSETGTSRNNGKGSTVPVGGGLRIGGIALGPPEFGPDVAAGPAREAWLTTTLAVETEPEVLVPGGP